MLERRSGQLARCTYAMVLAGGRGSRLKELTDWRCKPAVPFGGKYRIIDFTLSNCVNSGVRRIGVATQYKAHSLIRHLQRGWSFLDGRIGFLDVAEVVEETLATVDGAPARDLEELVAADAEARRLASRRLQPA